MAQAWGLSNSRECLAALRDKKIVGFLQGALPVSRSDIARGTTTLVFEDGTGFTFNGIGAYWHESADDVKRALERLRSQLEETGGTLAAILGMAGARG